MPSPPASTTIELKKTGKGTLYANAYLEVFTLEDKLRAAGLEVKVQRRISKLIALEKETEVPDATGLIAKQQVERFRREPLADGAKLASGDRIEVELILESKNDYEYLIFSDAKAAGFEALDALSGYIPATVASAPTWSRATRPWTSSSAPCRAGPTRCAINSAPRPRGFTRPCPPPRKRCMRRNCEETRRISDWRFPNKSHCAGGIPASAGGVD